ncbi:MAG: hypothetical protein ACRDJV_03680 [Actinomycetota bacterium]
MARVVLAAADPWARADFAAADPWARADFAAAWLFRSRRLKSGGALGAFLDAVFTSVAVAPIAMAGAMGTLSGWLRA